MKTKRIVLIVLIALSGTLTTFVPSQARSNGAVTSLPVYADALLNGWGDWSWGGINRNLASTAPVHSGINAIAVTYTLGWSGLQFGLNNPLGVSAYDTLRFWIHGGASGGQVVQAQVSDGTTILTKNITPVANTWTQVDVPLNGLGQVTLLAWFNNTGGAQSVFYVDDVAFVDSASPTVTPPTPASGLALSVDAAADLHAISPDIYGMNWADETLAADVDLPVRRWGGNAVTRYNWQNDTANHAVDWFFENIPNDNANPGLLPNGSASDQFVEQDRRTGTKTIMTMPLIGWTPKSRAYICGFSVQKYGPQQSIDSPWHSDCGNGLHTNGTEITGNDPTDTSLAIGPSFDQAWISHLIGNYGTAANGGVMFYNLDNEPMLWNTSHRDVHPQPVSYDEMRTRTYAYAAAIKAADPGAQILGPAEWGWEGYFYSALDIAAGGANWQNTRPDRKAHGDIPFTDWYLQQMKAYEQQHGTRILDYLDLHFYPQGNGIFSDSAGSSSVQALRLRSTRALWDPTYVDESWINQTVYMIPRMHAWVNNNYPGTKIALGEYSWGAMGSMNGALAEADVLGILGREDVDLAALWDPPSASQPGAYAFRMYRNYDGLGGSFGETSLHAASTDQDKLAIYAARRSQDGALTFMVINKTGQALNSALTLANFPAAATAQVYRYSSANLAAIVHQPDQALTAGGFTAAYPANSITLMIIPAGSTAPIISGNVGLAGATLNYTGGTSTSAADGSYSFPVSSNWSGTVTPTRACYIFSPLSRSYSNVTVNQTGQNYTSTLDPGPGCADVAVTIGGVNRGSYGIPSVSSLRMNYAGLDSGPVKIASTNGALIISAIRDAWAVNGVTQSFVQLMGLPASQVSDTYLFPAYNNVTLNEQLRIGNVDTVDSNVTVTIGGVVRGTYLLQPSEAVRVNYAGLDSGPVVVQGTLGVHIVSAIRDAWIPPGGAATTSFVQLMGLPATQVSDRYLFPIYNNVALNEQLRFGNVGTADTTVTVTIGGVVRGTYFLHPSEAVRVNYAGLDSGPVVVQSSGGVHIIAALRDAWVPPGGTATTSFSQLMGLSATQLSDTYLFPAYNNVTLNEQFSIGVP